MKFSTFLPLAVSAAFITSASATVTIDWVTVGDPGNRSIIQMFYEQDSNTSYKPFGTVNYTYQIGKYEVTNAQYVEFLNAKASTDTYSLYNGSSSGISRSGSSGGYTYSVTADFANRPVLGVSWYDAARFSNWLANGQGSGDTETGSYMLNGATTGFIPKASGAQIYIPTVDEWVKAAYYDANLDGYWRFPTMQNSTSPFYVNYGDWYGGTTDVGGTLIPRSSYYGTYDQGGNAPELVEIESTSAAVGGAYYDPDYDLVIDSSYVVELVTPLDLRNMATGGFRLASVAIPEPSAMILTVLFGAGLVCRRKR